MQRNVGGPIAIIVVMLAVVALHYGFAVDRAEWPCDCATLKLKGVDGYHVVRIEDGVLHVDWEAGGQADTLACATKADILHVVAKICEDRPDNPLHGRFVDDSGLWQLTPGGLRWTMWGCFVPEVSGTYDKTVTDATLMWTEPDPNDFIELADIGYIPATCWIDDCTVRFPTQEHMDAYMEGL